MLYRLLGMAVWKGGKLFLRRRMRGGGIPTPPVPVLAGAAALAVAGGLAVLAARRGEGG